MISRKKEKSDKSIGKYKGHVIKEELNPFFMMIHKKEIIIKTIKIKNNTKIII